MTGCTPEMEGNLLGYIPFAFVGYLTIIYQMCKRKGRREGDV
jgi:hypothetical protein